MAGLNRLPWNITSQNETANVTVPGYIDVDIFPRGLHWFLNTLMVLITILGIIGNSMVCYYYATKRVRTTSFNLLLLNLSIADLLADIFAYPQIFVDLRMLRDIHSKTADILCAFTIGVTPFATVTYVSVITLSYISLNRYVFIKFPLKTKWFKSRRKTFCFIAFTWVFSITFIAPNVVSFKYDPQYAFCYRVWPEGFNGVIWTSVGVLIGVILPIFSMMITFIATMRHFKKKTMVTREEEATLKRKKGAVVLLGFLIIAVLVCWSPSFIYLILSFTVESIWPQGNEGEYLRMRIIRVVFLIALTNSVADPFIYAYKNPEYNQCFRATFDSLKISKKTRRRERSVLTLTTTV